MTTDVHRQPDLYPPSTTVVVYCGIFFPSHLSSGLSCHIYSHAMPSTAWFLVNSSLFLRFLVNSSLFLRMSKRLVKASRKEHGFSCVCDSGDIPTAKGLLEHMSTVHRKKDVLLCKKMDCFLTYYADQVHICLKDVLRAKAEAAAAAAEPVAD